MQRAGVRAGSAVPCLRPQQCEDSGPELLGAGLPAGASLEHDEEILLEASVLEAFAATLQVRPDLDHELRGELPLEVIIQIGQRFRAVDPAHLGLSLGWIYPISTAWE